MISAKNDEKSRVCFLMPHFFEELKNKRVMYIKMLKFILLDKSAVLKRHLLCFFVLFCFVLFCFVFFFHPNHVPKSAGF